MTNILGAVLALVFVLGFAATWQKLARIEQQIDEVENLINQLGGIVGAYIDAMEGDGK